MGVLFARLIDWNHFFLTILEPWTQNYQHLGHFYSFADFLTPHSPPESKHSRCFRRSGYTSPKYWTPFWLLRYFSSVIRELTDIQIFIPRFLGSSSWLLCFVHFKGFPINGAGGYQNQRLGPRRPYTRVFVVFWLIFCTSNSQFVSGGTCWRSSEFSIVGA